MMLLDEAQARDELLFYVQKMQRDKLTAAKTGNLSLRVSGGLLITPTAVAYEQLTADSMVFLSLDGVGRAGELLPSSEWHFHCDVYREKTWVNGIVHTHSTAATAISCVEEGIPAFHYMVALFGGSLVPCAPYATFATEALSLSILQTLGDQYSACLLQNHGLLTIEKNLLTAYQRAVELESLAQQYVLAKQLGSVKMLTEQQMQEAKEAFSGYGQEK